MQFKINILKNTKGILVMGALLVATLATQAQTKIDGVGVVVGKNIVLDSDIVKFKKDLEDRTEGKVKISDCEMLEQLMMNKLLAHHAVIDSVTVSDEEVNSNVDRSIQYFTQQLGDLDKVLKIYGFNSEQELRKEIFRVQKENLLVDKEEKKITEKVDVTPEEVRIYYNGLKEKNELPEFPAEIEIAQIVLNAEPSKEEHERVVNKLNAIKKEIEEGASFRLKAIINSDDTSVGQNGGNLGAITKDSPFIKEFKEVAFSLDLNQISDPFKTIFGYHIVQLNAIKGNQRVVSHILLQPEITDAKVKETKEEIIKLKKDIEEGKITFEEAARKYSEDKETKNSGGLIINPQSGETRFDLTRMPPALYAVINDLKKGEITDPMYDETREGEKKYKIILMKDRADRHKADLVKDYVKVQRLALQKKKEEIIEKWAKEKIRDTYIKLGNDYKKCVFEKNWKKENN